MQSILYICNIYIYDTIITDIKHCDNFLLLIHQKVMKKFTSLLILALGVSTLFAQTDPMYLHTQGFASDIPVTRSSDNNRYFVGCFNGDAMFYDYGTGESFSNVYIVTEKFYEFKAVSNDGVTVGAFGSSLDDMQPMTFTNNQPVALPQGNLPNYYYGCANGISADGNVIGGFIDTEGNTFSPVVWTNGVPTILSYPDKDPLGLPSSGCIIDHVNADGSVITGRLYTDSYDEIGIVWKLNSETGIYESKVFTDHINYDFNYTPDDFEFFTRCYVDFTTGKLSGNGKYLIATYVTPVAQFMDNRYPILFDLESNDTITYKSFDDALGIGVSNDGMVTIATPFLPTPHRDTYVFAPNNNTDGMIFEQYIEETYGYTNFPTEVVATAGTMVVSNDGTSFFGYARGTYTGDIINIYFMPTAPTSVPEVTQKENVTLEATVITDGIVRVMAEIKSARIFDTTDRKSTRLDSSHIQKSRIPSSA